MLPAQCAKGNIGANVAVQLHCHAALLKLVNTAHNNVFFKFEPRDTIGQQTACAVIAVIDSDLDALRPKPLSSSKTTRPRTNYAHAFGALLRWCNRCDPAVFPSGVGDVFLDGADGYSAVARLFDHTVAFAKAILWADTAANLGESVCRLANLIGLLEAACCGQVEPVGDIVVQWAVVLTIRNTTLATAAGLLFGLGLSIFLINLAEVLLARTRRPLLRHVTFYRYKFQHWLLCHSQISLFSLKP